MRDAGDLDLEPDDLVERVIGESAGATGAQRADAALLGGFLGRSSVEEHVRLYPDPTLSTYVEVSTTDVLHRERVQGGSAISTRLWVKPDAPVRVVHSTRAQAQSLPTLGREALVPRPPALQPLGREALVPRPPLFDLPPDIIRQQHEEALARLAAAERQTQQMLLILSDVIRAMHEMRSIGGSRLG